MLSEIEINERFGFHRATLEGPNATAPKHAELRQLFMAFVSRLDAMLPDVGGDERLKKLALDRLEEASMWSHKAIAQEAPLLNE